MKARVVITMKEAQKVLNTQYESDLIEDIFETGLESIPEKEKKGTKIRLAKKTEWSIVFEAKENNIVSAKLDWKNEIMGFGTGHWGHDPVELQIEGTEHFPIFQLIKEGYQEEIPE